MGRLLGSPVRFCTTLMVRFFAVQSYFYLDSLFYITILTLFFRIKLIWAQKSAIAKFYVQFDKVSICLNRYFGLYTISDVFLDSSIENVLWKKLCIWSWFSTVKTHFLAEFIVPVNLIYFLQNSDQILVSFKIGWLILSLLCNSGRQKLTCI